MSHVAPGSEMAQHEPVARIERSTEMNGREVPTEDISPTSALKLTRNHSRRPEYQKSIAPFPTQGVRPRADLVHLG